MKNTPHIQSQSKRHQTEARNRQNGGRFPEISASYQASSLKGTCGKPAHFDTSAFSDISRDYFAAEEPRGFAVEAAVFAALIATALLPIVNGVQAVASLIQHTGIL
ncbi:MAG: hypothetical protein ABI233_05395 [Chthoniobacterales bacterium]